jgi:hypothetical protein
MGSSTESYVQKSSGMLGTFTQRTPIFGRTGKTTFCNGIQKT